MLGWSVARLLRRKIHRCSPCMLWARRLLIVVVTLIGGNLITLSKRLLSLLEPELSRGVTQLKISE